MALGMLAVPVFAQEANETEDTNTTIGSDNVTINESEVGALPDSWDYGFKRFFENVDKFFTFDKAEKAKKQARYGKLRAVEAHIMSGKAQKYGAEGNEDARARALQIIEDLTADQNQENQDAEDNIEAAVEEGTADEGDVEEVQSEIRNSITVLQRVYEKAPESAKDGLARALNNSINNYQRHVEKMEQNEIKKQEREENRVRDRNETDDDDEQLDEEEETEVEENETETVGPGNSHGKGNGPDKVRGQGNDDDEDEVEEDESEDENEQNETETE